MVKKYKNTSFIVFIVCCFTSIFFFLNKDIYYVNQTKNSLSNFFSLLFKPKSTLIRLNDLENINDSLIKKLNLTISENRLLKQRIRDAQDYYKYIQNSSSTYSLSSVRVLNHSMSSSAKIFTIDKGYLNGIPKESKAVINYDGNLVGRTFYVSKKTAQVHKINDKNFHVFVKTKNNIKGQFTYKNGNRGVIESIAKKYLNEISIGDTLYTTSSSNIYASDIPVAKIINVENNPIRHELDITVEILANINTLRNVFVVKK